MALSILTSMVHSHIGITMTIFIFTDLLEYRYDLWRMTVRPWMRVYRLVMPIYDVMQSFESTNTNKTMNRLIYKNTNCIILQHLNYSLSSFPFVLAMPIARIVVRRAMTCKNHKFNFIVRKGLISLVPRAVTS